MMPKVVPPTNRRAVGRAAYHVPASTGARQRSNGIRAGRQESSGKITDTEGRNFQKTFAPADARVNNGR